MTKENAMDHVKGTLQYDRRRGVVYFFGEESGACELRIEGIRGVPKGTQIDIHLVHPGNEHHHERCGDVSVVQKGASADPGSICAVKLVKTPLDA